jgi:hypothetical protein
VIPSYTRLGRRVVDLRTVERATGVIEDLNASLERRLLDEARPGERLRMLRETTNQVTRTANDAIHAYRRATAAVQAELDTPRGDHEAAREMRLLLTGARADVLRALDVASRRYSWPIRRQRRSRGRSARARDRQRRHREASWAGAAGARHVAERRSRRSGRRDRSKRRRRGSSGRVTRFDGPHPGRGAR